MVWSSPRANPDGPGVGGVGLLAGLELVLRRGVEDIVMVGLFSDGIEMWNNDYFRNELSSLFFEFRVSRSKVVWLRSLWFISITRKHNARYGGKTRPHPEGYWNPMTLFPSNKETINSIEISHWMKLIQIELSSGCCAHGQLFKREILSCWVDWLRAWRPSSLAACSSHALAQDSCLIGFWHEYWWLGKEG